MTAILKVRNLTKIYSLGGLFSRTKITAVDRVSFSVQPAEIFTLAGESGCGKTTTARMILGFEYPTAGELLYENQNLVELRDKKAWFKRFKLFSKIPLKLLIHYAKLKIIFLKPSKTSV